jgi:cell division protease FtsH
MNKNIILLIICYFNNVNSFVNTIYLKKLNMKPLCLFENASPYIDKFFKKQDIENIRYTEFIKEVENGHIKKTFFSNNGKKLLLQNDKEKIFKIDLLPNDNNLMETLLNNNVIVEIQNRDMIQYTKTLDGVVLYLIVFIVIIQILRLFTNNNASFGNNIMMNQNENLKITKKTNVTFNDVAGIDNVKLELEEVVQFLKDEERFTKLGAQIPRGIILEGPSGTGKTLLARAVAGESGVPFFSVSGSEFIELFVGSGASRIRTLFKNAKENSPSIIFIDEIDAIGKQRNSGMGMGNDEREQTLNQLLSEMDGFQGNTGVIVIAATNRADILDSALLRSGRFDRKVYIDNPDYEGRLEILKLYSKNKPLAKNVNLQEIAKSTPNFSGASLENLMNEAAIFTVRNNATTITNYDIIAALDRITLGAQKKNNNISLKNKEIIAVHEAGHAIVASYKKNYDKVSRISIAQRGNAGGLTFFTPDEERVTSGLVSRDYLDSLIHVALGGIVAEEIIFGPDEITTGASNDLERVTSITRSMIVDYGMSKKIGTFAINDNQISASLQNKIDKEILKIVDNSYKHVKNILENNIDNIRNVAKLLIEKETISSEEFYNVMEFM